MLRLSNCVQTATNFTFTGSKSELTKITFLINCVALHSCCQNEVKYSIHTKVTAKIKIYKLKCLFSINIVDYVYLNLMKVEKMSLLQTLHNRTSNSNVISVVLERKQDIVPDGMEP